MWHALLCTLQEIDELLGQNLTEEDEEAIAAELDSMVVVSAVYSSHHDRLCSCRLETCGEGPYMSKPLILVVSMT